MEDGKGRYIRHQGIHADIIEDAIEPGVCAIADVVTMQSHTNHAVFIHGLVPDMNKREPI